MKSGKKESSDTILSLSSSTKYQIINDSKLARRMNQYRAKQHFMYVKIRQRYMNEYE